MLPILIKNINWEKSKILNHKIYGIISNEIIFRIDRSENGFVLYFYDFLGIPTNIIKIGEEKNLDKLKSVAIIELNNYISLKKNNINKFLFKNI